MEENEKLTIEQVFQREVEIALNQEQNMSEHESAVNTCVDLYKVMLEEKKLNAEASNTQFKELELNKNVELKQLELDIRNKEAKDNKILGAVQVGATIAGIVVSAATTIVLFGRVMVLEETGSACSSITKALISIVKPRIK